MRTPTDPRPVASVARTSPITWFPSFRSLDGSVSVGLPRHLAAVEEPSVGKRDLPVTGHDGVVGQAQVDAVVEPGRRWPRR